MTTRVPFDPPPDLVVVKVGGSLYDHRRLGPGLRQFLADLPAHRILVIAGGGPFAESVRDLDQWHQLGDETAHWHALQACHVSMLIVQHLLEGVPFTPSLEWWKANLNSRVQLLSCLLFLKQYENVCEPIPHNWAVTTDSIAVCAAGVANAKLVLLKSVDIPTDTKWHDAAAAGWVDAQFPFLVQKYQLTVEAMNFRHWLDKRA